ncbi:biopolymer transporter ExbD [Magnetospirillum sp. SS-4]|uniref:ExbD/TolR family protein n=1 Tax=Magnetospirillum sp. SS-4 TaxID=2681465 RepID=UPI0020C2D5A3|nr:biopolymer transporter ExbD [Magnetospirillum sp. SS-4]
MSASPRPGEGGYQTISEINVTPLVDVMLVLLIVFMVAAPLMTVGVPLDMPDAKAAPADLPKDPLVISVDAGGKVFIREAEVPRGELSARLSALQQDGGAATVFIKGDRRIDYGSLMEVMGAVQAAGFTRVSLLADDAPQPAGG